MKNSILLIAGVLFAFTVPTIGQTIFSFDSTANTTNSVEHTGVRVSGTATVSLSNSITLVFDNRGDEAGVTSGVMSAFGFHLPSTIDDDTLTLWSPDTFSPPSGGWDEAAEVPDLWGGGESYFGADADPPPSGNGIDDGEMGIFVFTYSGTVGGTGNFHDEVVNFWTSTTGTCTDCTGSNPTVDDYDILTRWLSIDTSAPTNPDMNPSEKLGIELSVVPEPSTYALIIGSACLGFVILRRRFQNKKPAE